MRHGRPGIGGVLFRDLANSILRHRSHTRLFKEFITLLPLLLLNGHQNKKRREQKQQASQLDKPASQTYVNFQK